MRRSPARRRHRLGRTRRVFGRSVEPTLFEFDFHFNKTEIKKMILQDGFGEVNFEEMYTFFKKVAADGRKQLDS